MAWAGDGHGQHTYRERVVDLRLAETKVVDRGIERGDLRADTDVRVVHELLVGPPHYRLLFSGALPTGGTRPSWWTL